MNKSMWTGTNGIIATIQFLLGAALFVAPWLLDFAANTNAAWTAWATGAAIGIVGLVSFAEDTTWPAWANVVLGAWAALAPWIVQFATDQNAMWTHLVIGIAVVASSIWELYGGENWTPRVTA